MRASLDDHGGVDEAAFAKLTARLRYVRRRLRRPRDVRAARATTWATLDAPCTTWRSRPRSSRSWCGTWPTPAAPTARAWSSRSRSVATSLSAQELNRVLRSVFPEDAIFRIDHFLGKEPVQNLLVLPVREHLPRAVLEPQLRRNVQITMAEKFGVARARALLRAGRGDPRRRAEPPAPGRWPARDGPAGRPATVDGVPERARAPAEVDPAADRPTTSCAASSQGYRELDGVDPHSDVETFVALRMHLDTWRWVGRAVLHPRRQAARRDGDRGPGRARSGAARRSSTRPTWGIRTTSSSGWGREVSISLGARTKRPGEAMVGEDVELMAHHQSGRRDSSPTSACSPTRWTAIPSCSAARTSWRRRGGSWTPSWTAPTPLDLLRAGLVGPRRGRRPPRWRRQWHEPGRKG